MGNPGCALWAWGDDEDYHPGMCLLNIHNFYNSCSIWEYKYFENVYLYHYIYVRVYKIILDGYLGDPST